MSKKKKKTAWNGGEHNTADIKVKEDPVLALCGVFPKWAQPGLWGPVSLWSPWWQILQRSIAPFLALFFFFCQEVSITHFPFDKMLCFNTFTSAAKNNPASNSTGRTRTSFFVNWPVSCLVRSLRNSCWFKSSSLDKNYKILFSI